MTETARLTLVIDKEDLEELHREARKLGLNNVSALVRMLIKKFLTNSKGGFFLTPSPDNEPHSMASPYLTPPKSRNTKSIG